MAVSVCIYLTGESLGARLPTPFMGSGLHILRNTVWACYVDKRYTAHSSTSPFLLCRYSLAARLASCLSCRAWLAISSLARLEVITKMASLQWIVRPCPSVSRPCNINNSHTCRCTMCVDGTNSEQGILLPYPSHFVRFCLHDCMTVTSRVCEKEINCEYSL